MSKLTDRLKKEPNYRPYCIRCSTMRRMTIFVRDNVRYIQCEIKAEEVHPEAAAIGVRPRVGCGITFLLDGSALQVHYMIPTEAEIQVSDYR